MGNAGQIKASDDRKSGYQVGGPWVSESNESNGSNGNNGGGSEDGGEAEKRTTGSYRRRSERGQSLGEGHLVSWGNGDPFMTCRMDTPGGQLPAAPPRPPFPHSPRANGHDNGALLHKLTGHPSGGVGPNRQ